MQFAEIEIRIPLNGKDPIEHISGIAGGGCTKLSELLFGGLGTVTSDKATEEMYLQQHDNPQFLNLG